MEEITDDFETACQRILGTKGRLSTAIPGFIARDQQVELAAAIAKAIKESNILVAEAGTGTGKTFAYLIPCLLSNKKVLISTATKTLQDQLFHKDLPMLLHALGLPKRLQNLKGRANYLCRYRIELHSEEGRFNTPQCAEELLLVREKMAQMQVGERSELPEVSEDSSVWPYVTSTTENCLGVECPHHQTCFLMKARKKALEADIVVINHHLFFADSKLKEEGFGELLPGVQAIVFDEAHQLAEIAANFQGERISTRQFREVMDDILREWPVLDLANQPLKLLSLQLDRAINSILSVSFKEDRLSWDQFIRKEAFIEGWKNLEQIASEILQCFTKDMEENTGLTRCRDRIEELHRHLKKFFDIQNIQTIKWLERFKHSMVLHSTPFEVAKNFKSTLKKECAYIFTSATLTMANSFHCFLKPLGLEECDTLTLPSPFNFKEQALLYLPRDLPDPKQEGYYDHLIAKTIPIITALGGRCFFLFTSHKALQKVALQLENKISLPLLIQGDEAKPILLARFRQLGNAVLLGTATFWEGVDVKGEALSCVIIDKLPFASPTDPIIRGKMDFLKKKGLSAFDELALPNAVIALKQGVGRLIRDSSDKGILMIADPRLTGRDYGRQIFASLPSMLKTRDEKTVLDFINQLALNNEVISA
ncbi:ATP-dependent DNA helicase [Legionella adelaidensis]|uniref:ATP-dependent DNA helicase n=1 Tax=Legionella adelaidensis TaxID=45056 RepID=UPI0007304B45|nr:ATP-dependent DNA helicase [Legionella adelaidensis]